MNKDLYVVTVEIKGTASDYEDAGHGVKHRIMDAGFKEENIKISSIRKLKNEDENEYNPEESTDVEDIIELYDKMDEEY